MRLLIKEWAFLKEYVALLSPFATALQILQRKQNITSGFVLPTLLVIQKKLEKFTTLTYTEQLRTGLLSSLEKRFPCMDLNDSSSVPYIIATVSHPKLRKQMNMKKSENYSLLNVTDFTSKSKIRTMNHQAISTRMTFSVSF